MGDSNHGKGFSPFRGFLPDARWQLCKHQLKPMNCLDKTAANPLMGQGRDAPGAS